MHEYLGCAGAGQACGELGAPENQRMQPIMREAVTFKNVSQPSDYGDAGTAEASSSALEPLNKQVS
jgi:hypothetical protein